MCDKFQVNVSLFLLIARAESGPPKTGSSGSTGAASYPVTHPVQQPSSQNLETFTASAKSADIPSSSAKIPSHPASSVKGTIRRLFRQFGQKIC